MQIECERLIFRDEMRDFRKTNYLTHSFFPYPARFIPQIPRYFIRTYMKNEGIILDPFCGSGTTLVESKLSGYDSYGIEINPLGKLLSEVKTTPLDATMLNISRKKLFHDLENFKGEPFIPEFPNRDYWFTQSSQRDLGVIKRCIDEITDTKIQKFYLVCLASIIKKCSNSDPQQVKPAITKRMKKNLPTSNPIKSFQEKVLDYTEKLAAFYSFIEHISLKSTKSSIIGSNAQNIELPKNSVHLIITSPPFLNAHDYFRSTKFEIFWTGISDVQTLTTLDKKLIGRERVSKSDANELHLLNSSGLEQIDDVIEFIFKKDSVRSYIMYKYFSEMKKTFQEFKRVLNPSGRFCITIGDNVVRKTPINTHELIIALAKNVEFETERVGYDEIKTHALMIKRNRTAGLMNKEWVMVFKKY